MDHQRGVGAQATGDPVVANRLACLLWATALLLPEARGAAVECEEAETLLDIPVAKLFPETFIRPTLVPVAGGVGLAVRVRPPVGDAELGLAVADRVALLEGLEVAVRGDRHNGSKPIDRGRVNPKAISSNVLHVWPPVGTSLELWLYSSGLVGKGNQTLLPLLGILGANLPGHWNRKELGGATERLVREDLGVS